MTVPLPWLPAFLPAPISLVHSAKVYSAPASCRCGHARGTGGQEGQEVASLVLAQSFRDENQSWSSGPFCTKSACTPSSGSVCQHLLSKVPLKRVVWVPTQGSSGSPWEGPKGRSDLPLLPLQNGDKEAECE